MAHVFYGYVCLFLSKIKAPLLEKARPLFTKAGGHGDHTRADDGRNYAVC